MTRATDHVTDHNELVGLLLTEATRFGYAPVSNGPFTYDDPGHIDEHNLFVDDLKAIATIAGRTFTTALPDTAKHGDPGHPADHDLLRAAVTEIQAWPAFNDATGGTVTEIDDYNGSGERWRVHTFTGNGTLDVSVAAQPFRVLAVGGGQGGKTGGGNLSGRGGNGGNVYDASVALVVGNNAVAVGAGGSSNLGVGGTSTVGAVSSASGSALSNGATTVGTPGTDAPGTAGGAGLSTTITGTTVWYSGGGGSGGTGDAIAATPQYGGEGGNRGGGGGGTADVAGAPNTNGSAGTANTGGGGGGGVRSKDGGGGLLYTTGGAGGSGVVIVAYRIG